MDSNNIFGANIQNKNVLFDWQDYLESTTSEEVPHLLFAHVEQSIDNGLRVGMVVEVPRGNADDEHQPHWPAIITKLCGPMTTLRYIGNADDKSNEIWCDLLSLRPLGWSKSNGRKLIPPENVLPLPKHLQGDGLDDYLKTVQSAPAYLLETCGLTPIDRIQEGMIVGVRSELDPYVIRDAEIKQHVGGRLLLQYLGTLPKQELWLFYTDPRIVAPLSQAPTFTDDLFKDHDDPPDHSFKLGMKLEALNPGNLCTIHPATVTEVIDNKYFLVKIDCDPVTVLLNADNKDNSKDTWMCTADHPYIFPAGWAKNKGLKFTPEDWNWKLDVNNIAPPDIFAEKINANTLGFEPDMKLEAVNPQNSSEICVTNLKYTLNHLLCLTLQHGAKQKQGAENFFFVSCTSMDIFPVGWCGTNDYELQVPHTEKSVSQPSSQKPLSPPLLSSQPLGSTPWCPKIYFNYRCNPGPVFSKKRLSQLPVSVGPGPVTLVLREVLCLFISVAYHPNRVLKELESDGEPEPGMSLQEVKAKVRKSVHRAMVEVVTSEDQVADFCRNICTQFQMCPYLFGPTQVGEVCPENCNSIDRNTQLYGKRGRPKGPAYKILQIRKNAALKKKNNKGPTLKAQITKKTEIDPDHESGNESDTPSSTPAASEIGTRPVSPSSPTSGPDSVKSEETGCNEKDDDMKKKDKRKIKRKRQSGSPPPQIFEMKTRGAKLPNFALQIKRGHWDKKDLQSIYNTSLRIPKKKQRVEYITESDTDDSDNDVEFIPESIKMEIVDDIDTTTSHKENNITKSTNEYSESVMDLDPEVVVKKEPFDDFEVDDNSRMIIDNNIKHNDDIQLDSNPIKWSVDEVYNFLMKTDDCKDIAYKMKEEDIDGQAFLMLNVPTVQEYLNLTYISAIKLCEHVAKVKVAFFTDYVTLQKYGYEV